MGLGRNNLCDNIKEGLDDMPKKLMNEKGMFRDSSDFCPEHFIRNEKVLDIIRKNLTPKEEEKNLYGEVFTPLELVCEMLSQLPEEVWTKEDHKWLDPANGIGNFPIVVYYKLMQTLKSVPEKDRSKHIIENMLYMNELNPVNVALTRKIFKWIDPTASPNIFEGDFLKQSDFLKQKMKIDGVNKSKVIIIGNPPFQDENRHGGKNKLYERFTTTSLNISNGGFLLFVTPDNIMTGNSNNAYSEIIKYNTIYVNFNDIKKRYFPSIGQQMCYFLIDTNTKNDNLRTRITGNSNNNFDVVLKDRPMNPVREWNLDSERIIDKYIVNDRNSAVYNRGTTASDYSVGKYKVIYGPNEFLFTDNDKLANGLGINKIVLFESKPYNDGVLDANGEYGVGPHTFYIPFKTQRQGKELERFFKSAEYKLLVKVSTTSQYLKMSLISHIDFSKILSHYTPATTT